MASFISTAKIRGCVFWWELVLMLAEVRQKYHSKLIYFFFLVSTGDCCSDSFVKYIMIESQE